MMRVLDGVVTWIERLLSWLPDGLREVLWLPVLVVVLVVGLRLLVRRAVPWLGRLLAPVTGAAVGVAGAVLLLPDLLAASVYRSAEARPPGILYGYGDAVAAGAIGAQRLAARVGDGLGGLARLHMIFIVVAAGMLLWAWNDGHCAAPEPPSTCVAPLERWTHAFGG